MPRTAGGQAGPAGPGVAAPGGGPAPRPAARARLRAGAARRGRLLVPALRRHWIMTALLLAGLVLRVVAEVAYRPALLYIDTLKYLYNAWPGTDPLGYKGVLKAILLAGNLETVAAVQHLLGLAMGVAIYALLLRRGAPRWLAAVAAAPVLLDAYELQIEQTIMPDVWFEALIVAGLVVLLWRPGLRPRAVILAGILLGLSATVWQGGEFLILPAAVYVLIAIGSAGGTKGAGEADEGWREEGEGWRETGKGWRETGGGWRRAVGGAALMCAAFALPIVGYMSVSDVASGHFWLSRSGTSTIYGRVAEAADCATLRLPAEERFLCPTAGEKALGPDGLDHAPSSPLNSYVTPPGGSEAGLVSGFTRAVITQQPLRVLSAIGADAIRLFAVHRATGPGDTPITRWQFQTSYPAYQNYIRVSPANVIIVGLKLQNSVATMNDVTYEPLDPSMGGKATVVRPLAGFLRSYQMDGGFTSGPVYLAATLLGLLGTLALVRRRARRAAGQGDQDGRDLALACCLFFITAVVLLLASDVPEFSWRYQLPAVVTLPPAGALGLALVLARVTGRGRRRLAADPPADPAGPVTHRHDEAARGARQGFAGAQHDPGAGPPGSAGSSGSISSGAK